MIKENKSILTLRLSEQESSELAILSDLLGFKTSSKTIVNLIMNGVRRIEEDKKQRAIIQELNLKNMELLGLMRKRQHNEHERWEIMKQMNELL